MSDSGFFNGFRDFDGEFVFRNGICTESYFTGQDDTSGFVCGHVLTDEQEKELRTIVKKYHKAMGKKKKKQGIHYITFNEDRQSVTIHFNKSYGSLGMGALQIARHLIKWSYPKP